MISPVCCVGLNGVSQPLVSVHLPCVPIETPGKQDAVQEHHPILKMHENCVIIFDVGQFFVVVKCGY